MRSTLRSRPTGLASLLALTFATGVLVVACSDEGGAVCARDTDCATGDVCVLGSCRSAPSDAGTGGDAARDAAAAKDASAPADGASTVDAGASDAGPRDATTPADAGSGATDASAPADAATFDASGRTPSEVIQAVRAIAAAAGVNGGVAALPLRGVTVTALKPAVGGASSGDAPGFFVQAAQQGPAIFVAIDPATLTPAPAPGDVVEFTAQQVATSAGLAQVTSIAGYARTGTGASLAALAQDVSGVDFAQPANVDAYESELVTLQGSVSAAFASSGAGYAAASITTTGTTAADAAKLRVPATLRESADLVQGCTFTLGPAPLWRFTTTAQPSVWELGGFSSLTCPAPRVVAASATSSTSVRVVFDRNLGAASVLASGSQFTASGLTVSAATPSGRRVDLTTSAQSAGATYTVTAASTVVDALGRGLDAAASTASFTGFACTGSQVVISQIYGGGGNTGATYTHDFIELHNRGTTPVDLGTWSVQTASASGTTWTKTNLSGTIAPGAYYLVQMAAGSSCGGLPCGVALPTPQAIGTSTMGASSGKVALVRDQAALTGAGCTGTPPTFAANIADFVGYASTGCFETAAAPAPSATLAVVRNENGCADSNGNAADFATATPAPRNAASAAVTCPCSGTP